MLTRKSVYRSGDKKSNLNDADRIKYLEKIVSRCFGGVNLSDDDLKAMADSPDGESDIDLEEEDFSVKVPSQNRICRLKLPQIPI